MEPLAAWAEADGLPSRDELLKRLGEREALLTELQAEVAASRRTCVVRQVRDMQAEIDRLRSEGAREAREAEARWRAVLADKALVGAGDAHGGGGYQVASTVAAATSWPLQEDSSQLQLKKLREEAASAGEEARALRESLEQERLRHEAERMEFEAVLGQRDALRVSAEQAAEGAAESHRRSLAALQGEAEDLRSELAAQLSAHSHSEARSERERAEMEQRYKAAADKLVQDSKHQAELLQQDRERRLSRQIEEHESAVRRSSTEVTQLRATHGSEAALCEWLRGEVADVKTSELRAQEAHREQIAREGQLLVAEARRRAEAEGRLHLAETEMQATQDMVEERLLAVEEERLRLERFSQTAVQCLREENVVLQQEIQQEHQAAEANLCQARLEILQCEQQQEVVVSELAEAENKLQITEGQLSDARHATSLQAEQVEIGRRRLAESEDQAAQLGSLLEVLRGEKATLEAAVRSAEVVTQQNEVEIRELRLSLDHARGREEDLKERLNTAEQAISDARRSVDEVKEREIALREERARLESEMKRVEEVAELRATEFEKGKQENAAISQALQAAQGQVEELRQEIVDLRAAERALSMSLEESHKNHDFTRAREAEAQEAWRNLQSEREAHRVEVATLQGQYKMLEGDMQAAKSREESLLNLSQTSQAEAEAQAAALQAQLEEAEDRVRNVEAKFRSQVQAAEEAAQARLDVAEARGQSLQNELERQREEIERLKRSLQQERMSKMVDDNSDISDQFQDMFAQMTAVDSEMKDFQKMLAAVSKAASTTLPLSTAAFVDQTLSPPKPPACLQRGTGKPGSPGRRRLRAPPSLGPSVVGAKQAAIPEKEVLSPKYGVRGSASEPEEEQISPLQGPAGEPEDGRHQRARVASPDRGYKLPDRPRVVISPPGAVGEPLMGGSSFEPAAEPQGARTGDSTLTDVSSCSDELLSPSAADLFEPAARATSSPPLAAAKSRGASAWSPGTMKRRQSQVIVAEALTILNDGSQGGGGDGTGGDSAADAFHVAASLASAASPGSAAASRGASGSPARRKKGADDINESLQAALAAATGSPVRGSGGGSLPQPLRSGVVSPMGAARRSSLGFGGGPLPVGRGGGMLTEDSLVAALSNIGVDPKAVLARADARWAESQQKRATGRP